MSDPLVCVRCGTPIEHWWQVRYEKWNRKGTKPQGPHHVGYCPGEGVFSDARLVDADLPVEPAPEGLK